MQINLTPLKRFYLKIKNKNKQKHTTSSVLIILANSFLTDIFKCVVFFLISDRWMSSKDIICCCLTWKQGDTYSCMGEAIDMCDICDTCDKSSFRLELGVINFSRSSSLDSSNCRLQLTILLPVCQNK